jgi:hypothetical protein
MDEFHVYYSHNPITYTLNKLIAQQYPEVSSQQITARGIQVEGAINVIDDGVWNIERTVHLLKKLSLISEHSQKSLHLFLPHTGFLLGKLIKIASKVSSYSYVEEGQYSSTKTFGFVSHRDVDCDELLEQLKSNDILEQMGISEADVMKVNKINNFFLDCEHSKYKGCYSLSATTFLGFPNIRQFKIQWPSKSKINFKKTILVVLPPLFQILNQYPDKWKNIQEEILNQIYSSRA